MNSVRSKGSRTFPRYRIIAVCLFSVACGTFVGACDTAPPIYPVQNNILRLIPEQSEIEIKGGSLFVLIEFDRQADASDVPVVVFLHADGATITALPGPQFCSGDASSDAATDGGTTTASDFVVPYEALLLDTNRVNTRESGLILTIPAGSDDALLTGTVYQHTDAPNACSPNSPTLVAIASVRITRSTPTEAGTDAGAPIDASAPDDAADALKPIPVDLIDRS